MPAYINLTHRTFVCTKCSAHHRSLQFKVKGISMTQFTDDDVKLMESGGNGPFNVLYMAKYVPGKDMPIPNGNDANRMKEFINMKYNKKWYSSDGVNTSSDFGSDNYNERRTSIPTAPIPNLSQNRKSIGGGSGMDLLDMMDSIPPPNVFSPTSQQSNNFDAFGSSSSTNSNNNNSGPSQGFDAFNQTPSMGNGAQNNGFKAFGSTSAPNNNNNNNNSFDAFSTSSQQTQSFDNFGQPMTFQQPQMQNQAFAQPQNGFMNQTATNFGQPAAPMVFIKTAPPAPAPASIAPPVAPSSKPVIPGFSAFDDLVIQSPAMPPAPAAASNTANPFDMANPFNNSGPPQQQYGMPPQQQYGMPPQQQFGGMPPQQQFAGMPPQQQQYGGMPPQQQQYGGMPPQQQQYGMPPQQQQYGMPPQQQQYGMPPQQQMYGMPPGAPFQQQYNPNMGAPPQSVVAPVVAPPAPDPFSSMTGLAFETVGKAPPPRLSVTPPPSVEAVVQQSMQNPPPVAAPPAASANPFDMF